MKITSDQLINELANVVDYRFAEGAVNSYVEMLRRFLAGDWQPTEVDAGRLCEAVSWALYQMDQGISDGTKNPGAVRDILLSKNYNHNIVNISDRFHILKAIEVVYKFRSDRGPVHISPIHDANYMDSMFVLHSGKWILAEFLRLTWNKDRNLIGEVIAQLVQLEHSLIHELDGKPMVLATSVTAAEEVLLLLSHAPNNRLSRSELGDYIKSKSAPAVSTAISRLVALKQVRRADNGEVALTPNGQRYLSEVVFQKINPNRSTLA